VQTFEQRHDFQAGLRVKVPCRLVGQQNGRIVDERSRYRHPLTLTTREFVGTVTNSISQLYAGERVKSPGPSLLGGNTRVHQRQFHVVERGGSRHKVERLEYKTDFLVADSGQLIIVELSYLVAVQQIAALRRSIKTPDEVHEGRFSRP
ncbi:uncharacterized protein METZ01_LOCUS88496, partial [marine metagenome]